jgi:hypothetical protein
MNFGRGVLTQPLKPEILREIARYDAENAAEVCARARAEAGLQKQRGNGNSFTKA